MCFNTQHNNTFDLLGILSTWYVCMNEWMDTWMKNEWPDVYWVRAWRPTPVGPTVWLTGGPSPRRGGGWPPPGHPPRWSRSWRSPSWGGWGRGPPPPAPPPLPPPPREEGWRGAGAKGRCRISYLSPAWCFLFFVSRFSWPPWNIKILYKICSICIFLRIAKSILFPFSILFF